MNLKFNLIILSIFLIKFNYNESKKFTSDGDEYVNTTSLIQSKGYPAEEHDVVTDDGYILTMHRIPYSRFSKNKQKFLDPRPVVFLQHGLLDASSTWAINFPGQSLSFVLSDAGFDVWMGNMRGNTYGMKHTKLDPKKDEFWDFSWDDMAEHDLPSMINYVLKLTGQKDLIYMGHSQGTLIAFSQLGKNFDLASKIRLFIALGPVATVRHMRSPIKYLADIGAFTKQEIWYQIFGKQNFLPSSTMIEWFADKLCNLQVTDKFVCENILFAFCGPSKFLNQSRVSVYTTHAPAGTSVKNLAHFGQMAISGKFEAYDYGSAKKNMLHYNQTTPPQYDLTSVKVPVGLYWANNDWLAGPVDVQYIRKSLPNIVDDLDLSDYDHLDFVWATNAKSYLYDRIIDLIHKFI